MENGLKEIRRHALVNGLILGFILLIMDALALFILAYSQSILLISLSFLFTSVIIPLAVAIVLIKRLREKIGGFWTLRQATSGIFILFFSAYLVSSAGTFVFTRYIEPEITMKAKNNSINVFGAFFDKMHADPDKIDQMTENIEQRFDVSGTISIGAVISGLLSSIIILFVLALIFAALFKRERPDLLTGQSNPNL